MQYQQLKQLIAFCDSLDSQKLIQMVNDAGFVVGPTDMRFIEVLKIVDKRVWVLYEDTDRFSDCHLFQCQIHFDWVNGEVTNLDFVQMFE